MISKISKFSPSFRYAAIALLIAVGNVNAMTNTGMPWESALIRIRNSMTGPTALSLGGIGFAGMAMGVIYHHEIGQLLSRFQHVAIVVAIALGAVGLIGALYGVTGAVI